MKKYVIRVTETLSRTVIIEADSKCDAEEFADELCNDGVIDLRYEDFTDRGVETVREATKDDEEWLEEKYSKEKYRCQNSDTRTLG